MYLLFTVTGEVTWVTSTGLPNMGLKSITEAWWVWHVTQPITDHDSLCFPHRGGILTCAHMLPPSSQRKSSQREDFELGLHASHHLKNNPPKGRIPKRWDKNLVQEILPEGRIINRVLLIEGYLHVSTFYSVDASVPWEPWEKPCFILERYI